MGNISDLQENSLKNSGVSQFNINAYRQGKASGGNKSQIDGLLNMWNQPKYGVGASHSDIGGATAAPVAGTAQIQPGATSSLNQSLRPGQAQLAQHIANGIRGGQDGINRIFAALHNQAQQMGQRQQDQQGQQQQRQTPDFFSKIGPRPTYGGYNNPYPTYSDGGASTFQVPNVQPKDMSAQGNAIATTAYAPYVGSFDTAKTNASAAGARDQQMVGGLYNNYVNDIASRAATQATQYADAGKQAQSTGDALNAQIGQNYQGANTQLVGQLGQLGLQAAAPVTLGQAANAQAAAQTTADQGTKAQTDAYAKDAQANANQQTANQNIAQNQGVVKQSDIAAALSQQLGNLDVQKAGAVSQANTAGMQLGQQLSTQDLEAQRSNAGYAQQQQSNLMNAAQNAYNAQVGNWTAGSDAAKYGYQQQLGGWQSGVDMASAQLQNYNAMNQQDFSNQMAINTLQNTANTSNLRWGQGSGSQLSGQAAAYSAQSSAQNNAAKLAQSNQSKPQTALANLESQFGQQGQQLYDGAMQSIFAISADPNISSLPIDQQKSQFFNHVRNNIISQGGDPSSAETAATEVWNATH